MATLLTKIRAVLRDALDLLRRFCYGALGSIPDTLDQDIKEALEDE